MVNSAWCPELNIVLGVRGKVRPAGEASVAIKIKAVRIKDSRVKRRAAERVKVVPSPARVVKGKAGAEVVAVVADRIQIRN